MANNSEYWIEVESIFAEALDRETDARPALLDDRCAGRPELRAEVDSLIDAHLMATGIEPMTIAADTERPSDLRLGSVIGPFRLVELIGTGGMSTVYRAERVDATFSQQVAIKLIAVAISHPATGRRFRAERQILASLRHPNIVTLMDGGVTSEGLGYLVIEYVEGKPISAYCRDRALPLQARVQLFRQVCSAVQYAHRHFVVHRDLKPSNILITSDGVVKILDFGIAKLLDDPAVTAATTAGPLNMGPLTPNYASPEQLRGLTVTTSSDIYALGVLLYELLTGARPYETTAKPLDEVMHLVLDMSPPKPSAAVASADAAVPYDSRHALKGDLDAIVLRAMSKEPERRYGSPEELADDLARYLEGQPIVAREPSLGYIVRKLAGRHKAAVATAGVSTVIVLAASIFAIWQARVATAEQHRAEQRFNDVRQLANALVFDIHDAVAPLAGSTPVRQRIVREALQYLERLAPDAHSDPALQVELARGYVQIGKVQGVPGIPNLGDRDGAIASLTKARAILAPLAAVADAPVDTVSHYVEATRRLSAVQSAAGHQDLARATASQAVAVAEACSQRHPGDEKALGLVGSSNFAAATATAGPDSLPFWNRAGDVYEKLLAARPDDPERQRNVALVAKYLGEYYSLYNDDLKGLQYRQRALALDEQRLAKDPVDRTAQFDVANDFASVANSLKKLGDLAQAAGFYERSLSLRAALAKSDPADDLARRRVAFAHGRLAQVYGELGELLRASDHAHAALTIYRPTEQSAPAEKLEFASVLWALGDIEAIRGRRRDACTALVQAFDLMSTLPEATRRSGAVLGQDRLIQLAPKAASCGVTAARKWLASDHGVQK